MAIQSGMFRSNGGDRKYKAAFFASYFASFIGNGVFPNPSSGLQVTPSSNLNTVVKAGKAWINGYYMINDSDFILNHDIADGSLSRIDRVVTRLDFITREITIAIKKGLPSTNPVAPTLQRDNDIYELALADVRISNGLTVINASHITDLRFNSELCGIVSGVVNQIDTTNLFAQYQVEFDNFFETVRNTLGDDTAGELLLLINQNTSNLNNLQNSYDTLVSRLVDKSSANIFPYNINVWSNGSLGTPIGSTDVPIDDATRIRSNMIPIGGMRKFYLKNLNNYYNTSILEYDSSLRLLSASPWLVALDNYQLNPNTVNLRFIVRKSDNTPIDTSYLPNTLFELKSANSINNTEFNNHLSSGNTAAHTISNISGLQTALNSSVKFTDYVGSLSTNGYQRLPNGLIIQWGRTGSNNVTFPIAFTTIAFSVQAILLETQGSPELPYVTNITNTGCNIVIGSSNSNKTWIAIGY